ncbi:hypothetical protein ES703_71003 [subsurface metagenome]
MVAPLVIVGAVATASIVGGIAAYYWGEGEKSKKESEGAAIETIADQLPMIIGVIGIIISIIIAIVMYMKK